MSQIELPEFSALTEDDWQYFLSFGTPNQYLDTVAKGLQEQNRYFTDFRFLKLIHWYARYCNNAIPLPKGMILYRARLYNEKEDCKKRNLHFKVMEKKTALYREIENWFLMGEQIRMGSPIFILHIASIRQSLKYIHP